MNNISLCMIVKDEETLLAKCLNSVAGAVDEIVIVDTGSRDGTKNIARQYTDKVYDFFWSDDFAAARNFSLGQASNDWILVIDADEALAEFDGKNVKSFMTKHSSDLGRALLVNYFDDAYGERKSKERLSRFFNRNYYVYQGCIHEQLRPVAVPGKIAMADVEITIHHTGYKKDIVRQKNKLVRNIGLLTKALRAKANDPYLLYQLGKSYYLSGDYENASRCFKQALALPLNFHYAYTEELVESYGYALLNGAKYSEALALVKFEAYYGTLPDYLFVLGLIYMNNGLFDKAVASFQKCIGDKEGKVEGVNSYLPNYNIGVILECLGYSEQARQYYFNCGNYPLAVNRLEKLKQ